MMSCSLFSVVNMCFLIRKNNCNQETSLSKVDKTLSLYDNIN